MKRAKSKVLRAHIVANAAVARAGLTLDSGALIQLERNDRRVIELLEAAADEGLPVRIPVAALAEFWRGTHTRAVRLLIEAATLGDTRMQAQLAGEALAATGTGRGGPSAVDALVAAMAHDFGDVVLTTDHDDMRKLAVHLRGLRIIEV